MKIFQITVTYNNTKLFNKNQLSLIADALDNQIAQETDMVQMQEAGSNIIP